MTDRIKEQLSAFLDGELPDPESALLLKRLERDDELRGALSRYSLIGAVLRSDGDVPAARQVAARVSAAIAREPSWAGKFARLARREAFGRAAAGFAVAAGVALGAVVLVQQLTAGDELVPQAVVASVDPPAGQTVAQAPEPLDALAQPAIVTPPAGEGPVGIPPVELANFLVAHYGYASPLVRRSVGAGLISDDEAPAAQAALPADAPEQ
jgi:sigma-E factor negative regulatory protein RseA